MGSKYQRKFSKKNKAEGSAELVSALDKAAPAVKNDAKEPYDAGYMIAGGHAMTSVEIIRKD